MTNSKTEAFDLIRNLNTKHNIGLTDEEITSFEEKIKIIEIYKNIRKER